MRTTYDILKSIRAEFRAYAADFGVSNSESDERGARDLVHYALDDVEADIRSVTRQLDDARLALTDYILTHDEGELDIELLGIAETLTRARRALRDPKAR